MECDISSSPTHKPLGAARDWILVTAFRVVTMPEFAYFTRLPPEIRNHVYELLLVSQDHIKINSPRNRRKQQPPRTNFGRLLRVSKQINAEAKTIFYSLNIRYRQRNVGFKIRGKFTCVENFHFTSSEELHCYDHQDRYHDVFLGQTLLGTKSSPRGFHYAPFSIEGAAVSHSYSTEVLYRC